MATFTQYKDKNNKRKWQFNGYIATCPLTGKKVVTKRSGFDTKAEASLAFDKLKASILSGSKKTKNMTFKDLYLEWLEQHRKNIKESTVKSILHEFNKHILPKFGSIKLNKITVAYCQQCLNEWHSFYKNYRKLKSRINQVLNYGVSLEILDSNPMAKTITPRKMEDEKPQNFYTKDELKEFLNFVQSHENWMTYTFFRLLAFTGVRKSEALAITWEDVNFFNQTLTIGKTVAIDDNNNTILQTPKTKNSYRTISLDKETLTTLKKWQQRQREQLLILGFNSSKTGQLVFNNQKNKFVHPHSFNVYLKRIYKLMNDEGLNIKKITLHGFRHTHCSLLFEAGASIKEVQERLGHSDVKTTMNIYAHVTPEKIKETGERFAQYVNF